MRSSGTLIWGKIGGTSYRIENVSKTIHPSCKYGDNKEKMHIINSRHKHTFGTKYIYAWNVVVS